MSDYLADVLTKTFCPQAVVLPRLPGRFEPWPEVDGVAMASPFSREEPAEIRQPQAAGEAMLTQPPGSAERQPRQPIPAASPAQETADVPRPRIQAAALQSTSRQQPLARQLPSPEQIVSGPMRIGPAERPVVQPLPSLGEAAFPPIRAGIPERPVVQRRPSPENTDSSPLRAGAAESLLSSEPKGLRPIAASTPAVAPEGHIVQRHGEERQTIVEHIVERAGTPEPAASPRLQPLLESPAPRSSQIEKRDAKPAATADEARAAKGHVQPPAVAETPAGRQRALAALIVQPKVALLQPREPAPLLEQETLRPAPVIQVTIGRIEVRAVQAAPTSKRQTRATSVLSLEEYLRQRKGGVK